jgi:hypothetical protein
MARVYGAYSSGGTNRFRVGYEIGAWSAVTSSSTTVSADFQFFVGNEFAVTSDLQTFDVTWTENGAGTLALGGITSPFQVQITSTSSSNSPSTTERNIGPVRTVTYTYGSTEYGSSPGNFTGTITGQGSASGVNGFYTGGPATYNWSIPIPARPGGVPTSPSISASVAGQIRQATVSWSATADPPITRYDVYRNNDVNQLVSNSTATTFTDSSRGNNETLYYVMYAVNAAGTSGAATSNSVTTPALPGQPGSLAANTSTFGTIGLTWTASSTTAGYPVSYEIIRSGTSLGTTSSLSFNDTTVAPSTTYSYNVLPSSNVGTGTLANVSATSLGGVAKVWNGTAWVTILPKVWNGTAWVDAQARMWNGTSWVYGI